MKKKIIIISTILVIFLLSILGYVYLSKKDNNDNTLSSKTIQNTEILKQDSISNFLTNIFNEHGAVEILYRNKDTNEFLPLPLLFYLNGNKVSFDDVFENGKLKKDILIRIDLEYDDLVIMFKSSEDNNTYEYTIDVEKIAPPVLILKPLDIITGDSYDIYDFIESCTTSLNSECRYEYKDMTFTKITDIGEHTIIIIAYDDYNNSTLLETILIIKDILEENISEGSNNTSGNNNNKPSNPSNPDSNEYVYDTSNPVVASALSLVGKKGYLCSEVAHVALKSIGRSLWVTTVSNVRNFVTGETYADNSPEALRYNKPHSFIDYINLETENIDGVSYSYNNKYYVENEKPVKVEKIFSNSCPPQGCVLVDNNHHFLNQKIYYYTSMSELSPENIMKIGTPVSIGNLIPGDFIYYSNSGYGSSHIAVYIGNNKAVHGGWLQENSVVISGVYLGSGASSPQAYRVK